MRVHATSVNIADWYDVVGRPYVGRTQMGLRKPKTNRLGVDYAGTVDAVGKNVTQFRPGDEVFGGRNGAYAEYVCAREERAIVPKPPSVTFEEAAAAPVAALTALQGLRDKGNLEPGQKVLINGASGWRGHVRGADRQGARRGRDRRLQYGECGDRAIARRRSRHRLHAGGLHAKWTALRPDAGRRGEQVVVSVQAHSESEGDRRPRRGTEEESPARADRSSSRSLGGDRQRSEARLLHREVQQGGHGGSARLSRERKMRSVVDRRYELSEIADALEYIGEGHAKGKIVLTVRGQLDRRGEHADTLG